MTKNELYAKVQGLNDSIKTVVDNLGVLPNVTVSDHYQGRWATFNETNGFINEYFGNIDNIDMVESIKVFVFDYANTPVIKIKYRSVYSANSWFVGKDSDVAIFNTVKLEGFGWNSEDRFSTFKNIPIDNLTEVIDPEHQLKLYGMVYDEVICKLTANPRFTEEEQLDVIVGKVTYLFGVSLDLQQAQDLGWNMSNYKQKIFEFLFTN